MTSTTWKASLRWIARSLLLLPATNLAFWSLGAIPFRQADYTWGEAVADVTFTALFLTTVIMAPGVVLYLLVLALLLSPILGLPMLYAFWLPDVSWWDRLIWFGPSVTYGLALQWRLAGVPGARPREPSPASPAPSPGRQSPP